MKIRNGFVSNSSSASFIITWKPNVEIEGENIDFKRAFNILFDIWATNEDGSPNFKDSYRDTGLIKRTYEALEESTVENDNGSFTTTFFTTMLNEASDFGKEASYFLVELLCSDEFEILSKKIDRD